MTQEQLVLLTVKELKAMAKENSLKGYSKLRKAELVELLAVEVKEVTETEKVFKEEKVSDVEKTRNKSKGNNFSLKARLKAWELKKEKNVINGKEYDLVLYYNNKWHTIIKSDEINMSSILATISLEMQDEQLKVTTKGFELLSKEVLEKVNPKLLKELPQPLKQQLFIEN